MCLFFNRFLSWADATAWQTQTRGSPKFSSCKTNGTAARPDGGGRRCRTVSRRISPRACELGQVEQGEGTTVWRISVRRWKYLRNPKLKTNVQLERQQQQHVNNKTKGAWSNQLNKQTKTRWLALKKQEQQLKHKYITQCFVVFCVNSPFFLLSDYFMCAVMNDVLLLIKGQLPGSGSNSNQLNLLKPDE